MNLIYTQHYLGPYILVNRQKQDIDSAIYHCPNDMCSHHNQEMLETMKYCYACSERLEYKQIKENKYRCVCDVIGDENFFYTSDVKGIEGLGDGAVVLMPSDDMAKKITHRDMFMTELDVSKGLKLNDLFEMADLIENCQEEITLLEESYGKENVKVFWGFINFE